MLGDATRAPFPDGAFEVVLSAYFTDLVPLSRLLPEVRRLLDQVRDLGADLGLGCRTGLLR